MIKYGKNKKFYPDKLSKNNIDKLSVNLIPDNSKILEIGCATGFVGEYLINFRNCKVYGVELSKDEATIANKKLTNVILGDIESDDTLRKINNLGKFDVIYASALIEHLRDPGKAIYNWKKYLKKDGIIIISTSNFLHWSNRIKLVLGNFEYQKYGIMDETHLRFFTYKTFYDLVNNQGYTIENYLIDSEGGGYPRISIFLSRFFPNLFAFQMVISASKK